METEILIIYKVVDDVKGTETAFRQLFLFIILTDDNTAGIFFITCLSNKTLDLIGVNEAAIALAFILCLCLFLKENFDCQ